MAENTPAGTMKIPCPSCGYDLRSHLTDDDPAHLVCPECGMEHQREALHREPMGPLPGAAWWITLVIFSPGIWIPLEILLNRFIPRTSADPGDQIGCLSIAATPVCFAVMIGLSVYASRRARWILPRAGVALALVVGVILLNLLVGWLLLKVIQPDWVL